MAEFNQSFHLPPQYYQPDEDDEEYARIFEKLNLDSEYITPQKPIAPPSTNFPLSSPYSVYQNNYLQNNGGFPSPSLSWNNGSNAVDCYGYGYGYDYDYDTYSKFLNPYTLPAVHNHQSFAKTKSSVSSRNYYSSPSVSFKPEYSNNKEDYNEKKTTEFINYLKLKGWAEEEIQELEMSNDPRFLFGYYGLDIHMMCMNQLGSMYLQRVIKIATPDLKEIILDAVLKGIFEVVYDLNGSYVFQKLVDCCSQEQLSKIVSALTKKDALEVFIMAVMTESGSNSIQRLISKLKFLKPLMKDVMYSLKPYAYDLMTNMSGRRLIEHCMTRINPAQCEFIYEAVVRDCLDLARNKEGYHVVSKAIETIQDPYRMQLLTLITDHALHFAQEPNGNFVLQKVIELENPTIMSNLCANLTGRVVQISKNKHGSHVVEKCLQSGAAVFVVNDILNSKKIVELAKNPFGNYVLQKALENLKRKHHELYKKLVGEVRGLSKSLENHPNGKRVLKCMEELESKV